MQPIKELKLAKANVNATVEVLSVEHLAQVLALQDETRAALPETQKMFVLPQPPEYFRGLLSGDTGVMIGVRVRGQLVAQMALMGPIQLCDAIQRNAITRNHITLHHAGPFESVVIAKSMTVHPAWRGNELSAIMLESVLSLPIARTADHVFAQISAENIRSWDIFLRHGFGIVAAAIDPVDNNPRFIMQKPALGFVLHETAGAYDIDHVSDFAAIVRLTEREALIGRLDDGVAFRLAFFASTEHAASWTDATTASSTNIA